MRISALEERITLAFEGVKQSVVDLLNLFIT